MLTANESSQHLNCLETTEKRETSYIAILNEIEKHKFSIYTVIKRESRYQLPSH